MTFLVIVDELNHVKVCQTPFIDSDGPNVWQWTLRQVQDDIHTLEPEHKTYKYKCMNYNQCSVWYVTMCFS